LPETPQNNVVVASEICPSLSRPQAAHCKKSGTKAHEIKRQRVLLIGCEGNQVARVGDAGLKAKLRAIQKDQHTAMAASAAESMPVSINGKSNAQQKAGNGGADQLPA
jgi:hypothetical protein